MNTLTRTRRRDLFAGPLAWLCALLIAAAACATVAAGEARTQESSGYSQDALTMLGLVNDYRAENGLAPVALDDTLTTAARRHSEDQVKYDFFDHSTVESDYYAPGSGPYERATQEGYPAEYAVGENIAYGYGSVERTFEGWVGSPSHNANLLNPDWQVMGLGYAPGGDMWTQAFGSGTTSATQEKPARSEASSGEAAPSEATPSKAAPSKAPSSEGAPSEYDAEGTPSEDEEASGEDSSGLENVTEEGGSIVCQNGSCQRMQSGESISSTQTGAGVTQRNQQSNENVQTQSYEGSGIVYRRQEHGPVQESSTGGERTDGMTTGSPTSGEETEDEAEEADARQRDAERDTEKPDDERATEGDDGGSAPTTSPVESGPVAKESGSVAEDNVTIVNGGAAPGGASGVAEGAEAKSEADQVMKKAKATAGKAMAAVDKAMKKAKKATKQATSKGKQEQEKKEAEEEATAAEEQAKDS